MQLSQKSVKWTVTGQTLSFQMHIPIKPKQSPWVHWESFLWKWVSSVPNLSFLPPALSAVELIKTRSQWYPPLMKEMFLSHSSFLGNRWLGFVQMCNILTKIPLKVTLEECRSYRFKFQTAPGNRRSKSKKLSDNVQCVCENLKLHGDNKVLQNQLVTSCGEET